MAIMLEGFGNRHQCANEEHCDCEICPRCEMTICTVPAIALVCGRNGYFECKHGGRFRADLDDGYTDLVGCKGTTTDCGCR